MSFNLCAWLVH